MTDIDPNVPEEAEEQPELTEEELPSQDPEAPDGFEDLEFDADAAAADEGTDEE